MQLEQRADDFGWTPPETALRCDAEAGHMFGCRTDPPADQRGPLPAYREYSIYSVYIVVPLLFLAGFGHSQEVALLDLKPLVPQQVVRCRHVEKEIGNTMIEKERTARKAARAAE